MFKFILSIALFAASALATIQFTNAPSSIEAGKSYTFTWTTTGSGPVTILLKNGPTGNLQTVGTITSSGTGGTFQWTAPSTYPPGSYAFEIDQQGSDPNYWGPVQYTGGSAASGSSTPSITSAPSGSSATPKPSDSSSTSGFSNKTTTSTTLSTSSKTLTTTSSAASASASKITSSNSAATLGSPVALVLGALAAMLYLQ